jgi:hypothetical protein
MAVRRLARFAGKAASEMFHDALHSARRRRHDRQSIGPAVRVTNLDGFFEIVELERARSKLHLVSS